MITMRTNAEPLSLVALSKKIGKVNSVLPRHMQWLVFKIVLVISDLIMIGLALRLAYFFRFEVSFGFFDQDALIAVEYYRTLVWLSSFLWILVYWINGLYNTQNLLGGTGIDYREQVKPWLGNQVALAGWPTDGDPASAEAAGGELGAAEPASLGLVVAAPWLQAASTRARTVVPVPARSQLDRSLTARS